LPAAGWLFDAYPLDGKMVFWLRDDKGSWDRDKKARYPGLLKQKVIQYTKYLPRISALIVAVMAIGFAAWIL
jgi:hypothetical protein